MRFVGVSYAVVVVLAASSLLASDPIVVDFSQPLTARDSLNIGKDPSDDANECLAGFEWIPTEFSVTVNEHPSIDSPTFKATPYIEVSFPSPLSSGVAAIDRVVCEWYPVRDKTTNEIVVRPAMVVVHESGSGMHVGRLVAVELSRRGLHAFLVQLPGYGQRRSDDFKQDHLVEVFRQGICDVRRARDAVAAIPAVDSTHIGLQGTSLGGFVATLAASLDRRFDTVFLLLCGGDLHGVLTSGAKDSRKALDRLIASGVRADQVAAALNRIEPLRIAHRLDPECTWLFSATLDDVVLPRFSKQLAEVARLEEGHHQKMLATHYSGVIFLPGVLEYIRKVVAEKSEVAIP